MTTEEIIQQLKLIETESDTPIGEILTNILKELDMEWLMLRQLMLTMPIEQVKYLMEERKDLFGKTA